MGRPEDEPLLARARGGDREATDALLRVHAPAAHALALRLAGNAAEADDLSQAALVKAYCGLRGFRGESGFRTWLFRILLNEHRSRIRRCRGEAQRQAEAEVMALAARVVPAERPDGALTAAELGQLIAAHAAALPDRQREALTLATWHGCTYGEIAAIMNCTYDTVKVHVSMARKRLREALKGYLEE